MKYTGTSAKLPNEVGPTDGFDVNFTKYEDPHEICASVEADMSKLKGESYRSAPAWRFYHHGKHIADGWYCKENEHNLFILRKINGVTQKIRVGEMPKGDNIDQLTLNTVWCSLYGHHHNNK